MNADKIFVMDKGQIVESGTPDHILKSEQELVKDFMAEVDRGSH